MPGTPTVSPIRYVSRYSCVFSRSRIRTVSDAIAITRLSAVRPTTRNASASACVSERATTPFAIDADEAREEPVPFGIRSEHARADDRLREHDDDRQRQVAVDAVSGNGADSGQLDPPTSNVAPR